MSIRREVKEKRCPLEEKSKRRDVDYEGSPRDVR